VEKPQEITASAQVPPPAPEKTPESKPDPKPKSAESPKPDPIAEALKKEQKSEPKKEAKPATKKQDVKPQPKFDADRIAALLDKRQPQRVAAAGDAINRTLAFGAMTGTAERLSQSELDALRAKLRECWNPPAGAPNAEKLKVPILIRFKQDGTLAAPPQPETAASDPFSRAMIDSAVRATIRCQPYSMLSPTKYDVWKEIVVDFSLDGMFGG
jgi:colicin import membrane protein